MKQEEEQVRHSHSMIYICIIAVALILGGFQVITNQYTTDNMKGMSDNTDALLTWTVERFGGTDARIVFLESRTLPQVVEGGMEQMFENDATRGAGPIYMVEFADYHCPYCRKNQSVIMELLTAYGKKIKYAYRDFPMRYHPQAIPAAIASECAHEQYRFWQYWEELHNVPANTYDENVFVDIAEGMGLDGDVFRQCLSSDEKFNEVKADYEDAVNAGCTGSPCFIINGRAVIGAHPYDTFKGIIEEELAKYECTGDTCQQI